MQPEVDYEKIGQRIKKIRTEKGLTQAELSEMVGCSNNHMSHIEVAQTKVSLSLLLQLSYALDTPVDYFLLDTPFAAKDSYINMEISKKLKRCSPSTLVSISKIIDVLLEQQKNEASNHF